MSAPPIAAVVVNPFKKLRIVLAPRKEAAIKGVVGVMAMNPAMVIAFAPRRDILIRCFPGRTRGLVVIRAASFRKATIEPVNVIPPVQKAKLE